MPCLSAGAGEVWLQFYVLDGARLGPQYDVENVRLYPAFMSLELFAFALSFFVRFVALSHALLRCSADAADVLVPDHVRVEVCIHRRSRYHRSAALALAPTSIPIIASFAPDFCCHCVPHAGFSVLNHRSNITAQGFATNSTENRILILVRGRLPPTSLTSTHPAPCAIWRARAD